MSDHPLKVARLALVDEKGRSLSMRAMARRLPLGGTGHDQVRKWESGKRIPTLALANALAEQLGFESGEVVQQLCREWKAEHVKGESS